jgi:hypothetical protein
MYSAPGRILAVALFFMSSLSGTIAFPQAVKFIHHAADPLPIANMPLGRAPCTRDSGSAVFTPYAAAPAAGDANSPCDTPPVNPCNPASLAQVGCLALRDLVQEDLATMGKPGQKILRARDKVLKILQTESACSAWFQEKDSNPTDTFRTLSFAVDRKADDFVLETKEPNNMNTFRNPYVAKVFQGDGRYATITINTNGAFFSPMATVVEVWKGGGPVSHGGPRLTNVGPYAVNTMQAQVLVLLHEFGHVLDLLPADANNVDGKSVQNTNEVLRFCRPEIESKVRRTALSAMR